MILRIRNSRTTKVFSLSMIVVFIATINPVGSYALTGGPAQPEFNSFTPIGTSDMVDLASGDFSYNIPLMDIGGFPINLAYSSGVTMDQEASWVGLGWDLSIGQINRQMRGLPDDFNGEQMQYENNIKDNYTVGASFSGTPDLFGFEGDGLFDGAIPGSDLSLGLSAQYNSYNGVTMTPSAGLSYDVAEIGSVGLNVSSGPDGLTISPNASLHARYGSEKRRDNQLGSSLGLSFNSRQGLSNVNLSVSKKLFTKVKRHGNSYTATGSTSIGSSISFLDNTYTPSIQDGLASANFTFNAGPGVTFFGVGGQGELTAFGSNQFLLETEKNKTEDSYGYNYTHLGDKESVLDFNREKDGNFSVNSTNLSLTNYTYDIYSVQGQGVGGMFRPYRSQIGHVHDNETNTFGGGGSLGLEAGSGNLFDIGVDVEVTVTSGKAGLWEEGNNALETFSSDPNSNPRYEEVYYKNVGDLSVDENREMYGDQNSNFGGYYPSRLKLSGDTYERELSNENEIKKADEANTFVNSGTLNEAELKRNERVRRNQTVLNVSYGDAKDAADNGAPIIGFNLNTSLGVDRDQTAGFVVTRNDGARYIYGEAIYNTTKREATFALGDEVGGNVLGSGTEGSIGNASTGLVEYEPGVDNSINNGKGDHYFNRVTTPTYAHTYLLTTLLSSDYSDVDDIEGPSAGDYGSYTNFEYRNMGDYKWRVPFQENMANYNEGLKTDPTDDKGSYVYGEKELSYIKKIETKTHIALFHISPRRDGYGVNDEDGGLGTASKMYKLDKVILYSRGEFYADGITTGEDAFGNIIITSAQKPTPIKTVHFEYSYDLCKGIPNNQAGTDAYNTTNEGGKLTLRKIYFTYRNSKMGKYSSYDFSYGDKDHDGTEDAIRNPNYNLKAYDIWGCYKPNNGTEDDENLDPISAPAFNYVEQEDDNLDDYAAAWSITDIELPSGGKIKIDYEADDYGYVQDKKAMEMFRVIGAGADANPGTEGYFAPGVITDDEGLLYKVGSGNDEAEYLYIQLSEEDQTLSVAPGDIAATNDIFYRKYLREIDNNQKDLIQFRFFLNMNPKGGKDGDSWRTKGQFDYVSGYFKFNSAGTWTVFEKDGIKYGSIPMTLVEKGDMDDDLGDDDINPVAKAGWQFGRKYLSKYIYGLPEPDASSGPSATINTVLGSVNGLVEVFTGPNGLLRTKEVCRRFIPEKSWIRLSSPGGDKIGGGCRVKQLVMTDEWAAMTEDDPSVGQKYGQEYTYTLGDGTSSGVATYEPVGSKENPLVQPVFVNINRVLAPDEENYMEKPFGESFFPSPNVTYSRVSVKNIERFKDGNKLIKHATGEVVTEFYTSKDYPTIVDQTKMEVHEDKPGILGKLLNINNKKHLTLSQGYLVHLNDMNGKTKSQRVYAEGQEDYISGVDYYYDQFTSEEAGDDPFSLVSHNTGRLNNEVKVLYPDGAVTDKTLGVEFDVINDFREKTSETEIVGINTNVSNFLAGAFPGIVPLPLPDYARHEDKLNMATTTKVINTYGIQREVVAHDAGASVYTRNLLWDAYTGQVLLTETVNEYGDKYYSLNYPAHWYYKDMGLACLNSGNAMRIQPSGTAFILDASIPGLEKDHLNNGDEVLLADYNLVLGVPDDPDYEKRAWVHEVTTTSFKLMDENGNNISIAADYGQIKVIRSGKRNLQSASMGSIVLQKNPLTFMVGGSIPVGFLTTTDWQEYEIINSGAVEFSDKWTRQCECGVDNSEAIFNPFVENTRGVWRANRSWLYLGGRHNNTDNPNPRNEGFYNTYSPFYYVDEGGNWHIQDENWTFTSEVTEFSAYGFELENEDALERKSAAQYGYNFSFPLAVGANADYSQMGYDGFEDYNFDGCSENEHFGFRDPVGLGGGSVVDTESHTGKHSLKLAAGTTITKVYHLDCEETPAP